MISKRFGTGKKASKISKRVLGMESLENRELLSINPLGYDGSEVVQTAATFSTESADFGTEAVAVSVSEQAQTSFKVSWDAAIDGAAGNASITCTPSSGTAVTVEATGSATAEDAGSFVVTGLVAGTTYNISIKGSTTEGTPATGQGATLAATPSDAPEATPTGLTSQGVTLTWDKLPSGAKLTGLYNVYVSETTISAADPTKLVATSKTNSVMLSGLDANKTLYYYIEGNITPKGGTAADTAVAKGSFKTLAAGAAASMNVDPVTNVKTAFTKASTKADASIKVTWKAPANYTGSYVVSFGNMADGSTHVYKAYVAAGAKLEVIATIQTADKLTNNLEANTEYSVIIWPDATSNISNIESTPTYCFTTADGKAISTADAPVKPATVALGAPKADVPGVGTVKITVAGTESDNATVGYYVGMADAAPATKPTQADLSKLVYVAKTAADTTVDLVGDTTKLVYVYSVGKDGTISDTATVSAKWASGTDFTALPTETDTKSYIKSVTATADSTTKNTYKVAWTLDTLPTYPDVPTALTDTKLAFKGFLVSYSSDGGATWKSTGSLLGADAKDATITGLNWGTKYTFKVEAVMSEYGAESDGADGFQWKTTGATDVLAKAMTKDASVAKAPAVEFKDKPTATNTGTEAEIKWTSVVGKSYRVVVTDYNKAVIHTAIVTAVGTTSSVTLDNTNTAYLTPGMSYDVTVSLLGDLPGTESSGQKVTVKANAYDPATVKVDSKKITLLGAEVTVTQPKKNTMDADATADSKSVVYTLEYTNVVDSKGKPDWNSAKTQVITTFDAGVAINTQLEPSTQYFARVVITDNATPGDATRAVTGKEVKFKTLAAPAAVIGKSGFGMSTNDIGIKFDFKDPSVADKNNILKIGSKESTYTYEVLVAADTAKADKVTGMLSNAKSVKTINNATDLTELKDKKGVALDGQWVLNDVIKLSDIAAQLGDLSKMKSVQIQLKVTYNNDDATVTTQNYATLYTKAIKITLPKWYVVSFTA